MSEQTMERQGVRTFDGIIPVGNRAVRYTTVVPERAQPASGELFIFVPGFIARRRCYAPLAISLAHEGHSSVLIAHDDARPRAVVEDIGAVLDNLADDEIKGAEYDGLHSVGHSLGGKYLLRALSEDTRGVDSFLPMASAGYGGVRPERFLRSITHELRTMGHKRITDDLMIARDAFAALHPGKLAQQVAAARCAVQIDDSLDITRGLADNGMRIVAIVHPDDEIINPHIAAEGMREAGVRTAVSVDAPYAGHNVQLYNPSASAAALDRAVFQPTHLLPKL